MNKHSAFDHPFFAAPQKSASTARGPVSYRVLGSGPAVLFIHGWPLSGDTYRDMAVELSDRYRCYVIDLPGAGASPGYGDWSDPLRAHTATVIELIDSLGLERVALVGHDSGGAIARWVAAELGDRATALVLSNTEITGHVVKIVKTYARLMRLPGSISLMRLLFRSKRFLRSGYGFGGCFADRSLITGDFRELFVAPLLADRAKFDHAIRLLTHVDFDELANLAPIHARITAPTRFVWGGRDPFFPIEGARAMAAEFANFDRLVEIADAKLFVHEEHAAQVAAATGEFLDVTAARLRAA